MNAEKVTISGKVIRSTIETMENFGRLGQDVLLKYGIHSIDEEKQYPYKLRSDIHRVAFDRFGDVSLLSFGFSHAERFDSTLFKENQEAYKNNKKLFTSNNIRDQYRGLENQIRAQEKSSDYFIKLATRSDLDVQYGAQLHKMTDTKFEFEVTMALELHQEAFNRGALEFTYAKYFGSHWDYEIVFDSDKSTMDYGYANLFWKINFSKKMEVESQEKIVWLRKFELKEGLMKSVLDDAEKQKSQFINLSNQLGKYLPPQIQAALSDGDYDTGITTRRKKLTIFFSDIVNFTSTSDKLQPEDLTKYLNEYFSEMTAIALDSGATIDKYIGDAMMVFFGDPDTNGEKEDARACVEMALRMQERMRELQDKWLRDGFSEPFQVRMGLNTGYCNVGNFGSEQRLTYTIIGGEVNVAQRLEASSDANGILMSYETYAHAQDMLEVQERETIKMKGINRDIKIYHVQGRRLVNKQVDKATPHDETSGTDLVQSLDQDCKRLDKLEESVRSLSTAVSEIQKALIRQ